MNAVAYVRDNLVGAWQVMFGRADGLNRLDTSLEGFWRSFGVIVLLAPFAAVSLISERTLTVEAAPPEAMPTGSFLPYGLALLVDWFAFPLLFALVARAFGLGARYVPFIVARNWASVIIAAMVAVVHALHLIGILSSALTPYLLFVLVAVALRFSYVITRMTLLVSMTMALPIVVLDLLTSLVIWSAFDRLV
jgi:hypothetical protein